jgi:class 3 adenylate cyclase
MTLRQTRAILFADVVGSSRLYERLGDERALAAVTAALAAMAGAVEGRGGEVVKTIGDAVMASFPAAEGAALAAIDLVARIAALPPVEDETRSHRLRVRAGLHFGAALHEQDDYFGDAVNVAARLAEMASAGQILTTADLRDALPPYLRALVEEFGEIELRGRDGTVRVARLVPEAAGGEHTRVGTVPAPRVAAPAVALALRIDGRALQLDAGHRRLLFGRDPACDVVLRGPAASRQHATLEWRPTRVVLVDHSSNGSWLLLGADPPVRLFREEAGLMRPGRIVFGTAVAGADADVLSFALA